jgi:hypothetical protein
MRESRYHSWQRNAYKDLFGWPEGSRLIGRPRIRCEENIKINYKKLRWKTEDWSHLAQDRDQWRVLLYTGPR